MKRSDIIVTIPHAGTAIPSDIRPLIKHDDFVIHNESDLYSDRIYTVEGVRIVSTQYSRIISDPNRAPDEIYTEGIMRSLGVVMFNLHDETNVFSKDPSLEAVAEWTHRFHHPFHDDLKRVLPGASFLIDGHTMWSRGMPGHFGGVRAKRADVVLGNLHFCSCSAETTDFFASFFSEKGYSVAINDPYPGRYILGTYCSRMHLPGIQIEFNRSLYLNEETHESHNENIQRLNMEFDELVTRFTTWFKGPQKTEEKNPVDMSEHSKPVV